MLLPDPIDLDLESAHYREHTGHHQCRHLQSDWQMRLIHLVRLALPLGMFGNAFPIQAFVKIGGDKPINMLHDVSRRLSQQVHKLLLSFRIYIKCVDER